MVWKNSFRNFGPHFPRSCRTARAFLHNHQRYHLVFFFERQCGRTDFCTILVSLRYFQGTGYQRKPTNTLVTWPTFTQRRSDPFVDSKGLDFPRKHNFISFFSFLEIKIFCQHKCSAFNHHFH